MDDWFGTVLLNVDQLLQDYVFNLYSLLVAEFSDTLKLVLIIAVIVLGVLALRGAVTGMHVFKIIVASSYLFIALNWDSFGLLVHQFFTDGTAHFIASLNAGTTPYEDFSILFRNILRIVGALMGQGSVLDAIGMVVAAAFYWLVGIFMMAVALGLLVCAKLLTGILLGLGPITAVLVLFEATRAMFNGWLAVIITLCIVQIIVSLLLMFVIYILLPDVKVIAIEMASGNEVDIDSISVGQHIVLMLIGSAMFIASVPIAQAIGNGARIHFASGYNAVERSTTKMARALRQTMRRGPKLKLVDKPTIKRAA